MNGRLRVAEHGSQREGKVTHKADAMFGGCALDQNGLAGAAPSLICEVEQVRPTDELECNVGARDLPKNGIEAEQRSGSKQRSTCCHTECRCDCCGAGDCHSRSRDQDETGARTDDAHDKNGKDG